MTLTNNNLMILSKFAMIAKKHIGLVRAIEMLNDKQYACDILIKATLSDSNDLIDLTKKISSELNIGVHLISAIESYINSLKEKNTTDDFVHDSKYFLIKLSHHLYGIKISGISYRQAVEKLLLNVEKKERTFCINLAREFYRFWRSANRSLAEIDNEQTLKLNAQNEEFIKLWDRIDQELFTDTEKWPLKLYAESMRQIGISEKDINLSQKIAKVIILELRNDHSNQDQTYRDAINRTQQLFLRKDLKTISLIVSREFYHYWVGNIPKIISVL
jgi:hypothetical protein